MEKYSLNWNANTWTPLQNAKYIRIPKQDLYRTNILKAKSLPTKRKPFLVFFPFLFYSSSSLLPKLSPLNFILIYLPSCHLVALSSFPHEKTLNHCHDLPCLQIIPPPPLFQAWFLIWVHMGTHSLWMNNLTSFHNFLYIQLSIPKLWWMFNAFKIMEKVNKKN